MWKAYSLGYLRHNKSANRFVFIISFLASMLLGTVSGIFYNLWVDQVKQSIAKTGSSQVEATPAIVAYIVVFSAASIALILMLHHAFAATMTDRVRQLGILQSAGATPRQIRRALTNEVTVVSLPAIIAGNLVGILLSWGFMGIVNALTANLRDYELGFEYSISVFLGSLFFSLMTAVVSAWIPARRLSRITPLDAIRFGGEKTLRRVRKYRLATAVLGVHGELACRSLYARRKAMRIGTLSLLLAVFSFVSMLNIFGLSNLSTQKTYFERYKDKWDFLITADTDIESDAIAESIRTTDGVESCIVHRTAAASALVPGENLSAEVMALGIENLNSSFVADSSGAYRVSVPIYILDDSSFANFCGGDAEAQIIAVNAIWDSVNSERPDRSYVPFLNESKALSLDLGGTIVEVTDYADWLPSLREEFKQYALSLVVSECVWNELQTDISPEPPIFTVKVSDMEQYDNVNTHLEALLSDSENLVMEGRIEEAEQEANMQRGLRIVIYLFAGLLAAIGLANVFASTLGQVQQRKREFARYFSLGLTPKGAVRILTVEAAVIALRPILLTILCNIPLMALMLDAGGISAKEFVAERLPLIPCIIFFTAVIAQVALAYLLGGRKICSMNLAETLKDERAVF